VWGYTPIIPALGRLRQEDCGFRASLGSIVRPCLKMYTHTEEMQTKTTVRYNFIPTGMVIIERDNNKSLHTDVEKLEPSYTAGRNVNSCRH
jgi:hypothetical protein